MSDKQHQQIKSIFENKHNSQQHLIQSANNLIRIINAYDAIHSENQINLDAQATELASELSATDVNEMRVQFQAISDLKVKAHLIDNLRLNQVLTKVQLAQWYEFKFYNFIETRYMRENIDIDGKKLKLIVGNAVNDLLTGHRIIDQQVIDDVFKTNLNEIAPE